MSKNPIINQTIDKMVKEKFLTIFKDAQKRAIDTFKREYLSQIKDPDIYDKIKFLNARKEEIKKEAEKVKVTAYFKNATSEDWIIKLFSSRTTILNVDDSEELSKSVYLGTLVSLISSYLLELKDSVPPYSFDLFIKGETDPLLFDLNYKIHLDSQDDYIKIKHWQANKIIKVVSFEASGIINRIQSKILNVNDALLFIEKDVSHFETYISNCKYSTAKELITQLSKLSFLSDYDFSVLNNESALTEFVKFVDGDLSWNKITPQYSAILKNKLDSSNGVLPFSDSPIIFYSIWQTIIWMKTILKGKSIQEPFVLPDYHLLAQTEMREAEEESDKLINDFNDKIQFKTQTDKETEAVYILELENLRHQYNDTDEIVKEYFAALQRGDEVENMFALNAFFFGLETHVAYLKTAYILRERIHYYIAYCRKYGGNNRVNYPNLDDGYGASEIMYLLHNMVLDNALHEKLSKIMDDFMLYTIAYCVPFEIALQNNKEQMHELFHEGIDRLLEYLEDAEPGNKIMYIQTRLKQLKQRELKGKQIEIRYNEKMDNQYTSLFREYLEIEADYIKETKDVQFIASLAEPKKQKALPTQTLLSFGYKQKDTTKLLSFITALNLKIDLLNEQHTTPNELIVVLSANEFKSQLPKIYFNCETTQLYYIFNKLKTHFSKLTFKNIEESQLFYTKNGTLLKGQNLSASKVDNPKDYQEIDRAFSLLQ